MELSETNHKRKSNRMPREATNYTVEKTNAAHSSTESITN
jgi:hypothetical protein